MKSTILIKKRVPLCIACFLAALVPLLITYWNYAHASKMLMGGQFSRQFNEAEINEAGVGERDVEKYFRPSRLSILNDRSFSTDFLWDYHEQEPSTIILPYNLLKTPEDTIINYFSVLRHGENLTEGKSGGCGTVGFSKIPFPTAYAFLTPEYQQKISYNQYLKSFEGIGHTNLIKLRRIPADEKHPNNICYFVEIETIEGSDRNVTYFAYYYGYIYIAKEGNGYKIAHMEFIGEDFLCAPYHGWAHNAEASVDIRYGGWCKMIKDRYPAQQSGYVKKVFFRGTDGNDYFIEFFQLTNDTDVEIAQYKKTAAGKWKLIKLDPHKCLEKNKVQLKPVFIILHGSAF